MDAESPSPFDSVRELLASSKSGNTTDAIAGLWQRYYARLVEFAEQQLHGSYYADADEDDVATDSFFAFCLGVRLGMYPRLETRDDVWHILVKIASRKVVDLARSKGCQKHGGTRQRVDMPAVACSGPSAEQLVAFDDQVQHLLSLLPDVAHTQIALMKINDFTEEQIAGEMRIHRCQVRRMLRLIRKKWLDELDPGGDGGGGGRR